MASKRRLRRRSCERKVRHESASGAWIARKHTTADKQERALLDVYACRFCKGWHVGHRKGSGRFK